ncbi:MAG: hypothetical protein GEV28_06755 [Actinophytocola sp.]|uniref:hypothetical protein n=1 Tax=Actinophytocola sp. TaxID=1872138 RepID=UPI00132B2183|nr:hypothetical protein [Actinophytocola sp.]MPZ80094.1 hypothetical protein [Actinophytocola sp.]
MPSVLGLSAWRLLIATCGFVGFGFAVATLHDPWPALSQQASLLAGVAYLVVAALGRRAERVSTWLRGATTVLLLLVCVTYLTVIGGDLDTTSSQFEHLVTPLLALVDWVAAGRTRTVRWWDPVSWVVFPLAYLIYFVLADVQLYRGFLDPASTDFGLTVGAFLLALVAAGYLLYGIAKARPVRPVPRAESLFAAEEAR